MAVVGAGWAGLAAAVRLVQGGASVSVFEMARRPGGRARQADGAGQGFDNGQHILIGAYSATLGLMRSVGADPDQLLLRQPLALVDPAGRGLRLPPGPAAAGLCPRGAGRTALGLGRPPGAAGRSQRLAGAALPLPGGLDGAATVRPAAGRCAGRR